MSRFLLIFTLLLLAVLPVQADTLTETLARFQAAQTIPLTDWKFHQPDVPGGEQATLNDSAWPIVQPGEKWQGENTKVWFRTRVVVPQTFQGIPTEGAALRLAAGMDDDGEIYVNGKLVQAFHWDDGKATLAAHVHSGEVYTIALHGINTIGDGQFHFARLTYDLLSSVQPDFDGFLTDASFVSAVAPRLAPNSQARMVNTLGQAEAQVDMAAMKNGRWAEFGASLEKARKKLFALAPLTRPYKLYYVGHAHIDMNWLWTWPETIDICQRTWDSATKLMGQFPDFGFVQSQPGAYVPIQKLFPTEFSQMQEAQKRGQWNVVGGLWDESDTNLPSGEALARSLFLGQRYFKTNFGRYATTGWLPDSFGHSWQMPQLMQGVGIQNFYHQRCGDDVALSWWQSPDGSRVLKANTNNYDEPIEPGQLTRPFDNLTRYGVKDAVVVFGVGDHGGGPTREQILHGKAFQSDPLLPKVQFVTADTFFNHLRAETPIQGLPIVNQDLQYVFEGCYSTHADLKKAVRTSENNLYAAEVFSSLASMQGKPYPTQGLENAWKPTAFAQFHDILCGTAIHSTYDWMFNELKPAFAFEKAQLTQSLRNLTDSVDTQQGSPGAQAVVVWNALSFPRTDVVRVAVPHAGQYGSAVSESGAAVPVQALDAHTLVFVARDVPAFGHRTYYLNLDAGQRTPVAAPLKGVHSLTLQNPFLRLTINKSTGAVTSLYDKAQKRELIAPGQPANVLHLLGDAGNAWVINYTGVDTPLTTQGATVELVANGQVCAIVRVTHALGKSIYTQDITLYQGLPRIDIPTVVQWHERDQLLKVAFPLQMAHPAARVSIPYGSISRPTNGQENPGQKWMDVTDEAVQPVQNARPISLMGQFNQRSASRFDGDQWAFDPALMPASGVHALGGGQIPFAFPARGLDNAACTGQTISCALNRKVLYVLGASAPGAQRGALTFLDANGTRHPVLFGLGDWVTGGASDNEMGVSFPRRITNDGQPSPGRANLWIAAVSVPAGLKITGLRLPDNLKMHVFALTEGDPLLKTPRFGLSVLNDSKYGSDTNGSTFRLTLLRSTHDPDPTPDVGEEAFTYSLLPHAGDWRTAHAEQAGLELNIPLRAVPATAHRGTAGAPLRLDSASHSVIAGAFKHAEDGPGYILRVFETQGRNTVAHLTFARPVQVTETDILERPLHNRQITAQGRAVSVPIGHDQIVTLRIRGL